MPPDNAGYYHAAYLVAMTWYVLYAASLWVRERRLSARRGKMQG